MRFYNYVALAIGGMFLFNWGSHLEGKPAIYLMCIGISVATTCYVKAYEREMKA